MDWAPKIAVRQQPPTTDLYLYPSFAGAGITSSSNDPTAEMPTTWWDEEQIETTVTREFVLSYLQPDEQARLDQPLGFGAGLTDDTYMEWIEEKAKRIFLILVDIGVPDQIFGVVDDSWDDDDLPLALDQVVRLKLTYDRDTRIEKRFFQRQFVYLLRTVQKGTHIAYDEEEMVPLELAERRTVTGVLPVFDKVILPGRPNDIFVRRRIPLGAGPGRVTPEDFLSGIETMKPLEHEHLRSLWASYTHHNSGYLLLTPVNVNSLKGFLTITPQSFKIIPKEDRYALLMNWLHCLADAVAFLHSQGLSHGNIRPSTVMLDHEDQAFLGDSGIFPERDDENDIDKETYEYSAPEQKCHSPQALPSSARSLSMRTSSRRPALARAHTSSSYEPASNVFVSTSYTSYSDGPFHITQPSFDPMKADIFQLGTVFLEIITCLLKRASRNFASHRASKSKVPSRTSAPPDSSFHKNIGQVESWMSTLKKDASKKEDRLFRGVSHILAVIRSMLSIDPKDRPPAALIQERLYVVLTEFCGMGSSHGSRGRIHCETRKVEPRNSPSFHFGLEDLRLASQRAAAEACASVNPAFGATADVALGNGGVIYGAERLAKVVSNSGAVVSAEKSRKGSKDSISKSDLSKIESRTTVITKTGSSGSEGKTNTGSSSRGAGKDKAKPKVKAWQAPVYAEFSFG